MRDPVRLFVSFILIVCLIIMMLTILASADPRLSIGARSAALLECSSGEILYSKDANLKLPMASTTKIMTALLAIELCDPDEVVEIPREACGIEGSSVYLSEGDTVTVRDLIYSVLLQSANDAATALAFKVCGDISSFADLMNQRAHSLGLSDTHFDNPHGLDSENHYTTAKDLARLAAFALKNSTFRSITSTYKYSFFISEKLRVVYNHNKMLRSYDGAIGVKTGYTSRAGRCLVSAAERNGITLVAVTLHDPDDWRDHTNMLDYGFSLLERAMPEELNKTEFIVPVLSSEKERVRASVKDLDSINLVERRGENLFSAKLDIRQYAIAPIKVGDKLGEIVIYKNGEKFKTLDITADEACEKNIKPKFNLFDLFKQ